jgi:hypothetical protein
MTPILTEFSFKEIKQDITSIADAYTKTVSIGYEISFQLQTRAIKFNGKAELLQYPLTDKEIHDILIESLKMDCSDASKGIIGIM